MTASESGRAETRAALEGRLAGLRPRLHRYCARMVGSVIDGEDIVQEALLKALAALDQTKTLGNLESWLFRIAHNAALDFLRRRVRADAVRSSEPPETIVDPVRPVDDPEIVAASLTTFMRLPVVQRSSVILMDVLGYSLQEICSVMDTSLPAVKSALNRGRTRLRELASEPEDAPLPSLGEHQRSLLSAYVERFNARLYRHPRHARC
jgi:RNA polymerase sigma-70 factor (ECF subfamily)